MIIEKIETFPLRWNYPNPINDARSKIVAKSALLIKISADNGMYGWGEAATFGDVADVMAYLINKKIGPLIIGKMAEPKRIAGFLQNNTAHYGQRGLVTSAISGIEIALWDILGKSAGLPVASLLGGGKKKIKVYASVGYYGEKHDSENDLEVLKNEIRKVPLDDFSGIKVKIGRYGIENDLERIKIARKMIGKEKILIVDANNALTIRQAIDLSERIKCYNVMFIEEPIPFGDFSGSKQVHDLAHVAIGGYELDYGLDGFSKYIENSSVDYIQPDAIWSGGIYECVLIAEKAIRSHISLIPHNFSTSVALSANLHVLNATDAGEWIEYDYTGNPFMSCLDENHIKPCNGVVEINNKAGLGIDPCLSAIEPFLIKNF